MAKHHEEKQASVQNNLKQCLFNLMGKQNSNNWADIPVDVLEMIMKRLSLKDYVGLRAVCSSWRAIVSNTIANERYCHPLPEFPCICLFSDASTSFNLRTKHELHQDCLVLNSSKQKQKNCCGTIEGWLILKERVEMGSLAISFFNPVTSATILVPHVLKFPKNLLLKKMVASSDPKSNCCLVGFFNDYCHIAYCKLNNDMSWNMIELEKEFHILDMEIIGDKLYVIATSRTIISLNSMLVYDVLQDFCSNPPRAKVLAKLPPSPKPTVTPSGTKLTVYGRIRYLVAKDEASGELFLIYMFRNFRYEAEHVNCFKIITEFVIPPKITSVEVFMLDTKKKEWNKVN